MIILLLLLAEFVDPINTIQITSKIVGGQNADVKEFPSFAALVWEQSDTKKLYCGGTYIRELWVLTAAHCLILPGAKFKMMKPSELLVRMGMSTLNDTYQERRSIELFKYEDYPNKIDADSNDIGLIKITRRFKLNEKVALATMKNVFNFSTKVVVVGFGVTIPSDKRGLPPSFHLQKVNLEAQEVFDRSIVCEDPTPRGACFGDSGGPLYVRRSKMLVGVVSQGICSRGFGIFVNVLGFRMWIWHTVSEAIRVYGKSTNCVLFSLLLILFNNISNACNLNI